MQIMAQLYDPTTGKRTEPVSIERSELAAAIAKLPDDEREKAVVIVLMEKLPTSEEWQFTTAPLMNATDFLNFFGVKDHGREEIHPAA